MNLHQLVTPYLRYLEILHRSADTIATQRRRLGGFVRHLESQGVVTVDQLGKGAVWAYQEELARTVTAAGTVLKTRTQAVRLHGVIGFLRWLYREDYVATDLARAIVLPKLDDPLPKDVIEPHELEQLLAAIDVSRPTGYRDRTILEVFYSTAIRLNELVHLRLEDLDLEGGYLHVRHAKGGRDRVVPIGATASAWVRGYRAEARPRFVRADGGATDTEGELFLNRWGKPLSRWAVGELVRVYRRRSGLTKRVTPHGFRVSCTTEMLRNGAQERILQEMLGHRSLQTLEPYTRLTINDLRAAHARFHPRERGEG